MKSLALLTVAAWLYASRLVRWLALYQQKEYRLDRFVAFVQTDEGRQEMRMLVSPGARRHPKSWKRPKITARVLVIAAGTGLLLVVGLAVLFVVVSNWQTQVAAVGVYLLVSYLLLPGLIGLVTVLSAIPARIKVSHELYRAQQKLLKHQPLIIGVGGSYGKTSTKYLLAALLEQQFQVFMTPKSYNTAYSIARSITEGYAGQEVVLLEYGAYKIGEIKRLTQWFSPAHAVITGFTEQHLELFGSVAASLKAEAELAAAIPAAGTVWYNGDDPRVAEILAQVPDLEAQTVAYKATDLGEWQLDAHGSLVLQFSQPVQTALVGSHYLTNIAGALKVAAFLGLSTKECAQGLQAFKPDERFVRSYPGNKCWVLDDAGTSNPEGFKTIISLAARFTEQPKWLIVSGIVDLGEVSESVHRTLAQQARPVFDKVLYVGSEGRAEFLEVFGGDCVSEQEAVISALKQLPQASLLTIEGRVPGWLTNVLAKKGVQ